MKTFMGIEVSLIHIQPMVDRLKISIDGISNTFNSHGFEATR